MKALNYAADRVNKIAASDLPQAFAAIGEAVWWFTIVNDSLRHNHRAAYDQAATLSSLSAWNRRDVWLSCLLSHAGWR